MSILRKAIHFLSELCYGYIFILHYSKALIWPGVSRVLWIHIWLYRKHGTRTKPAIFTYTFTSDVAIENQTLKFLFFNNFLIHGLIFKTQASMKSCWNSYFKSNIGFCISIIICYWIDLKFRDFTITLGMSGPFYTINYTLHRFFTYLFFEMNA